MKKSKIIILAATFVLLISGGIAQASTSFSYYNLTVPKFNGSNFSGSQTMYSDYFGEVFNINSTSVGADYTIDIRVHNITSDSYYSWIRNVGDGDYYTYESGYLAKTGTKHRLQLSNDLTTPVDVYATGKWRNN